MNQSQFHRAESNAPQELLVNNLVGIGATQAKLRNLELSLKTRSPALTAAPRPPLRLWQY